MSRRRSGQQQQRNWNQGKDQVRIEEIIARLEDDRQS